jgi:hypothetical protein
MAKLGDRWRPDAERLEGDRRRYWLRSQRYSIVEGDDRLWAVVPPDGVPLAEHLDLDAARSMAEAHDAQDQREQPVRER